MIGEQRNWTILILQFYNYIEKNNMFLLLIYLYFYIFMIKKKLGEN